jgi:hypothetical protein
LLQLGEYEANGKPKWVLMTKNSTGAHIPKSRVYAYEYTSPGRKRANLTMSDRPFIDDGTGNVPYSITASGLPPPVVKVEMYVRESAECYRFDVETIDQGHDRPQLIIRVADPNHFDELAGEIRMTVALASVGEKPTVVVSNLTHTYTLHTELVCSRDFREMMFSRIRHSGLGSVVCRMK